jgi:hypothetical protein
MKREAEEILKDALALPTEARAGLAGSLLASVDSEVDEEAEAAWATEVNRRIAELRLGEKRGRFPQNLVRPFQLTILPLEVLEACS